MWRAAIFLLSCWSAVWGLPAQDSLTEEFSTAPISEENYAWLLQHTGTQRAALPSNFKVMYVAQNGRIVENSKPSTGHWIQVAGSPHTPHNAVYTAALEVGKMLRHSPAHIFNNIANHAGAGLGLFTRDEKITIFPEFQRLRDTPECHGRCDGSCSHTCTFDGRKYESLGGLTGSMSIVLMDNVMCTAHDPHHKIDNILVHEFGHTVNRVGFSSTEKSQLTTAYNHAKAHNLWKAGSYAMANQAEYFAEATGSFFLVELQSSAGGMNDCGVPAAPRRLLYATTSTPGTPSSLRCSATCTPATTPPRPAACTSAPEASGSHSIVTRVPARSVDLDNSNSSEIDISGRQPSIMSLKIATCQISMMSLKIAATTHNVPAYSGSHIIIMSLNIAETTHNVPEQSSNHT